MVILLALLQIMNAAELPHKEELAPGVWAAGYSAKYGDANCGWVTTGGETVLIDAPPAGDWKAYVAMVAKVSGKPVRRIFFTDGGKSAPEGVTVTETVAGGEVIRYGTGRALYLRGARVLFAGPAGVNGPRMKLVGRDTKEWGRTLEQLEKLGAAKVVPGYGSWGGNGMLGRQRRFLAEVRRQVAYHVAMGRPLGFIEADVRLPAAYYVWMPYDEVKAEDVRHVYGEMTAPRAPYYGKRPVKGDGKVDALVMIGDRFHEPEHLEEGLAPVFAATGVTPHYLHDVKGLTAENLAGVELLVVLRDGMNWPEGPAKEAQIWMTPEQEKAVVDFVEGGGAFLNLHNSMGVYPKDGPYLNLVGGRYIGHGPLERFRVEITDATHPVVKGVKPFFAADEQHTPPCDETKVKVFLRNYSDDGKAVAAAGWAYEPGKGRLVHLASGHTREALHHVEYQKLMKNAVGWLLRR